MDLGKKDIKKLFQKYIDNGCSPVEIEMLLRYFSDAENEDLLKSLIKKESTFNDEIMNDSDHSVLLNETYEKIKSAITRNKRQNQAIVVPFYKQIWFRAAAVVVFLFLTGGTAFFLF